MHDTDKPRLIERAFPLKQTSLDSVHEKNVRHGHISTLHIWPARRPLAACRAALIATLLPDPGTPEKRKELCERIGGKAVKKIERKKMPNGRVVEREKWETEGGILHWLGSEPSSGSKKKKEEYRKKAEFFEQELEWFRQEIRKAYGGRSPKVLDPFAGGGAIPLEAMRLGCEATAIDINPVAWFILKCTLEYPQKLAGKTHPLPDFILEDEEFMDAFYKAHGLLLRGGLFDAETPSVQDTETRGRGDAESDHSPRRRVTPSPRPSYLADLAWHVRAWGRWVLNQARKELAPFYPTYADFEPLNKKNPKPYEPQPMKLVPLKEDGTADIDALNAEFSKEYLKDKRNPRWVAKPTVAYLWARTVTCKNCRATIPLLKTKWLCKKDKKRVLLTMDLVQNDAEIRGHGDWQNDAETRRHGDTGNVPLAASPTPRVPASVRFGVKEDVPVVGGNAAQRREHDKRIGAGTMSRAGAKCPCCPAIMTMEDIRVEGKAGRLSSVMTAVVVDTTKGKAYRLPTEHELSVATPNEEQVQAAFEDVPFGVPDEPTPAGGGTGAGRAFSVQGYGLMKWRDLFTPRQLLGLGTFVRHTRAAREEMAGLKMPDDWIEAVYAGMAIGVDRIADRQSMICRWDMGYSKLQGTFTRFALPITWDYCEGNPFSDTTGNYTANLEWVAKYWEHAMVAVSESPTPCIRQQSAIQRHEGHLDAIVTDPPYYDSIPYSDLMDFFYIWLRRSMHGLSVATEGVFLKPLAPKWDHDNNDGELIDDASRHGNDAAKSKQTYENGMTQVFDSCWHALKPEGRLVIVFAHKHPDAWETLVSAIIRAGFVVDGSWPIQTEMGNRTRALIGAALGSSVWLVCKKRPATARPGWDNKVLEEMRSNITIHLREFWDAGIKGPDFVWAATGPALEAYSKHPIVKKANEPRKTMEVGEFLSQVRRMVVDFVVGQVLTGDGENADLAAADRMDAPTAYYLLHRHDFGLDEAPSGACILYATACGLSDRDLESTWDILNRSGSGAETRRRGDAETDDFDVSDDEQDDETDEDINDESSGSKVKLKTWAQRKSKSMGYEASGGQPVPLVDRIHRLMHLWRAGDVHKVDEYLDEHGLRRQELFKRLLQSIIELSKEASDERSILESISNHVQAKGAVKKDGQGELSFGNDADAEGRGDAGAEGRGDAGAEGRGDAGTRGRGDEDAEGRGDAGTRRRGDEDAEDPES